MLKYLFLIHMISVLPYVSTRTNYDKLPDKVKKDIGQKWESCCKTNTCIRNSCFFVLWRPSYWASVRQRCQSQYPEWPDIVDIFHIEEESDLGIFWTLLQYSSVTKKDYTKSVWTSGSRCLSASSNGASLVTSWISTNESFPTWLAEKFKVSPHSITRLNSCEFLVVSLASTASDVKYDFQNQNAYHSSICEFRYPDFEPTDKPSSSTEPTTKQTPLPETPKEVKTSTTSTVATEPTITNDDKSPSSSISTTKSTTSVSSSFAQTEEASKITFVSTNIPRYCKAVNQSGIQWPDTPAGECVTRKCPKGMIGIAEWKCNENTLRFWPEKPQTEGCKHEWIGQLEDSISDGDDAVEISTRLAKKTRNNKMSHGDIIALVNVTSKLFNLYIEQKKEESFEGLGSEAVAVYYNFTKTMISSISNIIREEIKDAWEELNETRQTKEASTILKLVTTIGSRLSCMKVSSEKLQFTVSEKNIDLQTFILNNTSENNDKIRFPEVTENLKINSFITLPANLKLERWYSPCKTYRSAVGVVYKQVGDFLKAGQKQSAYSKIATNVLSFSLSNSTESIALSEGKVYITLKHLKTEGIKNQRLKNPRCVFWNFSKSEFGEWDRTGCKFLSSNKTHTRCQCDHLTNFAVLMDINDNIKETEVLKWMTYICCGFSSISLLLTVICLIAIRSLHGKRSIITGNLCFSLLISNGLILFGLDKTEDKIVCAVVAGFLHYWILSSFCWMLVEGHHLYKMVILVFQRGPALPIKFYYLFAYGAPLIIVGISALIIRDGYIRENYCWLSADEGLIWSFVGPACAIILVNIVIFILTLRSASSVKIKKEQSTMKKIKSWVRGSISVMCLLGLTWCTGLFYAGDELHFFAYIFTFLNGLQGVFIFFFHILLNDKVSSFFSCQGKNMYRSKKFLNQTSSNRTQSRTSLGCTSSTRLDDNRNIPKSNFEPSGWTRASNNTEMSGGGKKNIRKIKVTHTTSSNGIKPHNSFSDENVRVRSGSNPRQPGKHPQVLHKSSLTSF